MRLMPGLSRILSLIKKTYAGHYPLILARKTGKYCCANTILLTVSILEQNGNNEMRIGVDLGGTKIDAVALGADGKQLFRQRTPSPRGDYTATLESIRCLLDSVEKRAVQIEKPEKPATIGVGIPGTISPESGLVKNANSTWLIGHPLDQDLADILARPVKVANDANCFAMSEAIDGAAMGCKSVFGVILGTGVGGGIFMGHGVWTGCNAIAGEWGHNPLPWACDTDDGLELLGLPCYCGQHACIETFLSGGGLRRSYAVISGENLEEAQSAKAIENLAKNGDSFAKRTLELYATRLAKSLANIINILDPEVVVLGGGLSNIEFLYSRVPQLWAQWIFSDRVETKLVQNTHGDSSGVRGAAWLWPEVEAEGE